jgi:hypothetical protein
MPEQPLSEEKVGQIGSTIDAVLRQIGSFHIIDNSSLLPEGLKPIARSVSWLIEQIVVQNLRKNKDLLNLEFVLDPPDNVSQYDCRLKYKNESTIYYLNIKTSLTQTIHKSRFDVSKAPKLIKFYKDVPDLNLILAVIKIDLEDTRVSFRKSIIFNVAWIPDIYYNRANHNLQSCCDGSQAVRANSEFIKLLEDKLAEKGHTIHY